MDNQNENYMEQFKVISKILNSNYDDRINLFLDNIELLKNVYFIVPDPCNIGINYMKKFNDLNIDDIGVNYFFTSESLYCFNSNSIKADLMCKSCPLKIESLICLDTQIQSYLYRKYQNKNNSIPDNIDQILKLIKDRKWGIDCFAYTVENTLFNNEFFKSQIYFDNMYAFERYFFHKKSKAKWYTNKLLKYTEEVFKYDFSDWYRRQYKLYYLELLVMADIKLNKPNLSLFDKEKEYVKFFHEKINMLSDREANLAKLYFMYGTKISFFVKIQKGSKNIVSNLKNMAWDIFHIHNTINNLARQTDKMIDFTIPFFVTYDKRLKDILPIYKIKAIAFIKNTADKHFNYVTDLMDPIIKNEYFFVDAFQKRHENIKKTYEKLLIEIVDSFIYYYEKNLS